MAAKKKKPAGRPKYGTPAQRKKRAADTWASRNMAKKTGKIWADLW